MKNNLILFLSVIILATSLHASPLGHEMKSLGSSFKELKEMVKSNTFNYEKIAAIAEKSRNTAKKCASLLPQEIEKLSGDAKKSAVESYKKQIAELDAGFGKLGEAASKKDAAAIKASFDGIRKIMQKGHDDFRKDDG